jgi:membrane protease YdiL (CAAX protease family)
MSDRPDSALPPFRHLVLVAVIFEGSLAVVAVLLGWWLHCPPAEAIAWTWQGVGWGLLACLPMLVLLAATVYTPLPAFERLKRFFDGILVPLFRHCTWLDLAVISAVAGLGEEALFRGVIQEVIARWTGEPAGPWVGLAVASVIFGLLHAITPTYALLATVMGLYLGWLWIETENLLVPITAHGVYDFIALGYLVKICARHREVIQTDWAAHEGEGQDECERDEGDSADS